MMLTYARHFCKSLANTLQFFFMALNILCCALAVMFTGESLPGKIATNISRILVIIKCIHKAVFIQKKMSKCSDILHLNDGWTWRLLVILLWSFQASCKCILNCQYYESPMMWGFFHISQCFLTRENISVMSRLSRRSGSMGSWRLRSH